MLHILQEADSYLGDPKRTIEFSKSRNIPVLADDGGMPGIGLPMWQMSGAANVLLAANRALRDSYTAKGRQNAWKMYQEARRFIAELIQKDAVYSGYDNLGELLRFSDVKQPVWQSNPQADVAINQAFGLDAINLLLPRSINKPTKSRLIDVGKITGGSVDNNKLKLLTYLRERIIGNFAIDVLSQLSGGLTIVADYHGDGRLQTLIPPILQKSNDNFSLKSGREWIEIARENGVKQVRCLLI